MTTTEYAIRFVVRGTVTGQGSKTWTRTGLRDANGARLRPWREAVRAEADAVLRSSGSPRPMFPPGVPVAARVVFTHARPQHHYGTGRNAGRLRDRAPMQCIALPDIDKALRAVLDAITDAGVWADDRQVSYVDLRRCWAGSTELGALDSPGVDVTLRVLS